MNIIVLVKHAFVSDFRPEITADGKAIEKQRLIYEMNDWDSYALEEAVKIKEQEGGEVLAISVGIDCDDTLKMFGFRGGQGNKDSTGFSR